MHKINNCGREMRLTAFLIFSLFVCGAATNVYSATIAFDPNMSSITLGSTFTLNIVGTGFNGTEGGGAQFLFDPSILQVTSVTVDSNVWGVYADAGTTDNTSGSVTNIAVAAFTDPGANFTVASIEFLAVGNGTSSLILSENSLNPWASGGSTINPTMLNGSVTTSAVPLPAAVWLFSGGLLGLLGIARRKNAF